MSYIAQEEDRRVFDRLRLEEIVLCTEVQLSVDVILLTVSPLNSILPLFRASGSLLSQNCQV